MKTVRIHIKGRVQGVYFRKYTQVKARALGLVGYVQNQANGDVVAVAKGDDASVDAFISWCYTGSPASMVDSVEVQIVDIHVKETRFRIRWLDG